MWIYNNKEIKSLDDIPKNHKKDYGFIYEIITDQGKRYIGMKSMWKKKKRTIGKRELANVPDKRKIRKRKVKSGKNKGDWIYFEESLQQTDWLDYTGSSEELNEDIKNNIGYEKHILEFVPKKGLILYKETKAILCNGALEDENYYNKHVLHKFFAKNVS